MSGIEHNDDVIAVRSRKWSSRFIIQRNGSEKAEFWLKSKYPNNFYEISYSGRIIRSHTKKNAVFKFKDFQEKEYFRLDFDWGGKDEYLVEVQDIIDPPIAVLISTIMISLLDF